ncbi:glycosyltransferase family 1 protein [Xylariaceae sp. FL0255]|nr:glycosyltransferase family 1 protein [Xylariaceae sp. FL0255]
MSRPLELMKPSTASIDAESSLHERTILNEDASGKNPRALLRDIRGRVVYPNYVPPGVEPLEITSLDTNTQVPSKTPNSLVASAPALPQTQTRNQPPASRFFNAAQLTHPHFRQKLTQPISRGTANTSILHSSVFNRNGDRFDAVDLSSEDEQEVDPYEATPAQADTQHRYDRPGTKGTSIDNEYDRFRVANRNFTTEGRVSKKDGRLNLTVHDTSTTGYLAKTLEAAISKIIPGKYESTGEETEPSPSSVLTGATLNSKEPPRLNIVIMVIGSRGDIQPFLKIGKLLTQDHGHRVRIATHPAFREFVEKDSMLEFFSVGGENPGLLPKLETIKSGDIHKRRQQMAEMFDGFWRACINATENEKDAQNVKMMRGDNNPFVADAIIANPPSFAHIHCAEALGIPLHLIFTFPYTPTQEFPHPLANIKKSNVDPGYTNWISYPLVEMMVWQGLGDLINDFRVKTLKLEPVYTLWAPGMTYRLHVPFTYLWSPALVPKPKDWGEEIDISGYVFLDLASTFEPPQDLVDFLGAGEPPIYIGFGSIVVDDADQFTTMIFEAVRLAGLRALVSKGWGGLGHEHAPENIFMLENTPHDWLFPRVKACVIHGGAGTTAIALKCGKPTLVIPFFADQHFWGTALSKAGIGPDPIPYKRLTAENLSEGIKNCLTDEATAAAREVAERIGNESDGAQSAIRSFHRHLKLSGQESIRCSILHDRVAVWTIKDTDLKLSALAANSAVRKGLVTWRMLRLIRHKEWNDFQGPGEPVTGILGSLFGTAWDLFCGIGGLPYRLAKSDSQPGKGNRTRGLRNYIDELQEGIERSGLALARAPLDLSLAVAQGFHNAPRLYGDETVREPRRVTGFRSGLRAARDEFVYGIYDGVTGIVRLPLLGAQEHGAPGAIRGLAMGFTGFILKDLAAIFGPIAYTLQGLAKELSDSKKQVNYLRRARITQGQRELNDLTDEERRHTDEEVTKGWAAMRQLTSAIMEKEGAAIGCIPWRGSGTGKTKQWTGRAKGPGFDSVEAARSTLESITRGAVQSRSCSQLGFALK